jgi:aminoglycoside phosphotransferase (APT) family kinase protein
VGLSDEEVASIAGRFAVRGEVIAAVRLPGGHINDSYRVVVHGPHGDLRYLLQCLNSRVFEHPAAVMENVVRVTRHLASRMAVAASAERTRRTPALIPTREGQDWHTQPHGAVWRMFTFVDGAVAHERAEGPGDAYAAGRAFGEFLRLLSDYDGPALHETIAGFHDTRARFIRLEAAIRADPCNRAAAVRSQIQAVMADRSLADVLPPLVASGAVPVRIAHNDAKLANVLLDERTGAALCVVDLDTVMPGLALHDFGDLVRSVTTPTDEDEADLSRVGVRLPMFEALARGYLEAAGAVLHARERELLGFAGRLITLEQAVRFLTDYLEGDRYYRIEREDQNLARCEAQVALLRSLTLHAAQLDAVLGSLWDALQSG